MIPDELIRAAVARAPSAPAVSCGSTRLSYAELDNRVDRLARRLAAFGVGPEVAVGVLLERSAEMVVAILAVARAGGAYVPLDPDFPPARTAFMLRDSGAPIAATERRLAGRLAGTGTQLVVVDDDLDDDDLGRALCPAGPDNLAYVIYTSGSTGTPKGVEIANRSLANLLTAMAGTLSVGSADVLVAITTLAFDIAGLELWLPLITGGHLVVAPRAAQTDPARLMRLLGDSGATVFQATPATWRMLVDAGWPGRPGLTGLCGGEALPVRLADDLLDRGVDLWNLYGPTETAIWSTALHVTTRGAPLSVGRPIANTTLHIVDDELLIGGAGVARGYRNRPELTAERFVPDSGSGMTGARLYRTGDRARWRDDGTVDILGRLDDQVKVRGFRVECGEVEAALLAEAEVSGAAVVARCDERGDVRLVAYVVPSRAGAAEAGGMARDIVADWEQVFDEAQVPPPDVRPADPTFDATGWNSRVTGRPFPAAEMEEAVSATAARVLQLRPERVLEVGCGTGLLLWRIAPHCVTYVGTDLSAATLRILASRVEAAGLAGVRLVHAPADDLRNVAGGPFDAVVLNSVVQYFPDAAYLRRVLAGVRELLRPGGTVMVGDVRSLPLLPALHAALAGPTDDVDELVLDPRVFVACKDDIPGVTGVDVLLKRGRHHNELTRFRYDVLLRTDAHAVSPSQWCDWAGDIGSLETLRRRLAGPARAPAGVTSIPNGRLLPSGGIDPEDIWELAASLRYAVECSWAAADGGGAYDAAFVPGEDGRRPDFTTRPPGPAARGPLATDPVASRRRREAARALPAQLRARLRASLPGFMIPSQFVVLEALPCTPTGKVDRHKLPPPGPTASRDNTTPPRTATEQALARIWSGVLDAGAIGREDDFFDLGGHSLRAIEVLSAVETILGVELPLRAVFDAPTLAGLAAAVDAAGTLGSVPTPARARIPTAAGGGDDTEAPLSYAQQGLWFLDQLSPGDPFFTMPATYRLRGPLDAGALKKALAALVARHAALRTSFPSMGGVPRQRVTAPEAAEVPFEIVDIERGGEAEASRRAAAEIVRPFDLARGPLLRAHLLNLGPEDHVLVLTTHHIVSDGWSKRLVERDLAHLYDAAASGRPATLPSLPVRYADYARWQRAWLEDDGLLDRLLDHWEERLRGAEPGLDLPTDHARPAVASHRGATQRFVVGSDEAAALRALGATRHATLHMTLLAALQALLSTAAGQTDVVVGATSAGRLGRAELDGVVGLFANPLAIRTDLSGDPTFLDTLGRARRSVLDAFSYQDAPFDAVVARLSPPRDLGRHPLFQVALEVEHHVDGGERWEDIGGPTGLDFVLAADLAAAVATPARLDLEVFVTEGADGALHGSFVYATDLFTADRAAALAAAYQGLLAAVVADPTTRLSSLPQGRSVISA